jgi:hypothetical protein
MSIHHLGRQIGDNDMATESASHEDIALHLYLDALTSLDIHPDGLALLDSAVILFALSVSKSRTLVICGMMLTVIGDEIGVRDLE